MAIWYYTVLTHNVGFLSLMVKPFLSEKASACANVLQWVDLHILSTITWLLEHTNIMLWAPDQISPQSHSLWVELQCQKILSLSHSFSFLFFSRFHILRVSLENSHQRSHPPIPSPAPLHACTETDFCNSPPIPGGAEKGESLGKCSSGVQTPESELTFLTSTHPLTDNCEPGPSAPVDEESLAPAEQAKVNWCKDVHFRFRVFKKKGVSFCQFI